MSLFKQFKTNGNLEISGVDLNYGDNDSGNPILIKVARAGGANKNFQRVLQELSRPHKRAIATDSINPDVSEAIMRKVYARTVVLGWEGVEDEQGNPIPFNVENAEQLFADLPDLFADLREQANSIAIFRADVLDNIAKN